jgi:hypothetical protein
VVRPETLGVIFRPDAAEIVHPLMGDPHGSQPIPVQFEIGPERATREGDVAQPDGLVLKDSHGRARGGLPRLLDRPLDIGGVSLVISRDKDHGPVGHALRKPLHSALCARNQVAGDDQCVEVRAGGARRQFPALRQFEVDV